MNMDIVPKRKFVLPHIFFLLQIFKNQKTSSSITKNLNFDKLLTVLLLLMLPFFRSSCSQMLYKIDVPKDFAKTRKTSAPESCFNKVAGLQKETLVQTFSCIFCKIFKNTYFIKHVQVIAFAFWKSNNQNDVKKITKYKNVFLDTTKIHIY